MTAVVVRDVSRAGHVLGGARMDGLPERASVSELLRARVTGEVASYNDDPGPWFRGLVQPADSIRHSDGFRLDQPRRLDPDRFVTVVREALELGIVAVEADGEPVEDPDRELPLSEIDEITLVLERSLVAAPAAD